MPRIIRKALGLEDFRNLVRGGEISFNGEEGTPVRLILNDIGFDVMIREIKQASEAR